MRYLRTPLFAISIISLVFLGIEWKTILHQPESGTDFSIYYRAAGLFKDNPSGLYLPPQAAWDQYLYPPPCILIFRCFHLFPERTSYLLFIGAMYGCLVAALLIGQSLYEQIDSHRRPGETGYIIFALASAPVYHNIGLGQIECLVLLLSMLYLYFLKKQPLLAGILLAAAIWIKMYPVLLLLPALFSKEGRKVVLCCLIGGIGIMVVSLPFIPFHLYIDFSKKLAAVSQYTSANIINQSVVALGLRMTVPFRQAFEWPNIYRIPGWLTLTNYALLGIVLSLACIRVVKDQARAIAKGPAGPMANPLLPGAIMLAMGAAFSPLGWGHTFVFSLPLWILSMKKIERTMPLNIFSYGILFIMALLLLIPVYNHPAFLDRLPDLIQTIYYSRFLIITLFLTFYCMFELPQPQLQKISDC